MAEVIEQRREIQAKVVIAGVSFGGKQALLRAYGQAHGSPPVMSTLLGEASVLRTTILLRDWPKPEWLLRLTLLTLPGEADYNAVEELLLDNADGIIFLCPVDPSRSEELTKSLHTLTVNVRRKGRSLADLALALHYRELEPGNGFQPEDLDRFLGLEPGVVERFTVPSLAGELDAVDSVVAQLRERVLGEMECEVGVGS